MKLDELLVDPESTFEFRYSKDFFITVAPMPNPAYSAFLRSRSADAKVGIRGDVDPEAMELLTKEAIARHVWKSWRGLEDVENSWQAAFEVFRNPKASDIYNAVCQVAQTRSNFQNQVQEDDAGN